MLRADELVLQPLGFAFGCVGDFSADGKRASAAIRRTPPAVSPARLAAGRPQASARLPSFEKGPARCRQPVPPAPVAGAPARFGRGCSVPRAVVPRESLPAPFPCTCSGSSLFSLRGRALSRGQFCERLVMRALFGGQLPRKFRFDRGIQIAKFVGLAHNRHPLTL